MNRRDKIMNVKTRKFSGSGHNISEDDIYTFVDLPGVSPHNLDLLKPPHIPSQIYTILRKKSPKGKRHY